MTLLSVYLNALPFVFGLLVGSFLNVVIVRWPAEQSIIKPRSACPQCHNAIAWYDNIPVVSFLYLRARCRYCANPISWRYPLVELFTGFMSWATFHRFVPDALLVTPPQLVEYLIYFYLVAGLIAITFIDLEHHLIPDAISLPAIPIALVGIAWLNSEGHGLIDLRSAVLGALVGPGALALLRGYYEFIRGHEGMGEGDVKMMAMLGAFLGHHPALLFIIFLSSFLGSLAGIGAMVLFRRGLKYELPYGPFLAAGGLLYLFWGHEFAVLYFPSGLSIRGMGP